MSNVIEFQAWPKTPRLFRDSVITEKIDGTNAAIGIKRYAFGTHVDGSSADARFVLGPNTDYDGLPDAEYLVYAQSRNRIITPKADNYGFASWVWSNAAGLVHDLGPGLHFGEWWGEGINRGYGVPGRRFSLFNTEKWSEQVFTTAHLLTVPVITRGTFNTPLVLDALDFLRARGSLASPGWPRPEGVCVYHSASRQVFKALIENDEVPKSLAVVKDPPVSTLATASVDSGLVVTRLAA